LSIWTAGCVAVPLSPQHPPHLRDQLLADAGAAEVLHTEAQLEGADARGALPHPSAPDALAMLLFTSGTTGRPKGAMLTHQNLAAGATAVIDAWQLVGRRALLHVLPLHHMHGIAIALLPCLRAGMTAVMLPRFNTDEVWHHLADVDTFMAVPTMFQRLVASYQTSDPILRTQRAAVARRLGLITSGSAALPQTLAAEWQAIAGAIPLERWGMTEVGVGLSNPLDETARRRGWVGRPIGSLETRVEAGELWVRGPSVSSGYWQRPEETAAAFVDGWFRTGDVVAEEDGAFRIVGRQSVDIIKSAGYKIGALEIEECFRDHPAVDDIAVVGLVDAERGERVAAAVVLGDGAQTNPLELAQWARDRLAPNQIPRTIQIVPALPRNAVGKVQKVAVRALFGEPITSDEPA
jgi:malonyl-CoA/methylmalonyl-CoA synthetase